MPQISVITTLFNYKRYIEDAIISFLIQNEVDAEMIIVDDASMDNPYDVIKEYESHNIKYIKLDNNMGYSHAKNVGIEQSSSDILVMLDADDMLTEKSLVKRHKKITDGYDFVHGPVFDLRNGKKSQSKLWRQWLSSKKDTKAYKFIHAQSVMLVKDIHRKIGLYDETLRYKSDREMWARIFNHGYKIGYVNDYVSVYRVHSQQMHKSKRKLSINDKLQKDVLAKIHKRKSDLSGLRKLL